MKKVRLIADTFINGKPLTVDKNPKKNIYEFDNAIASVLISACKAEYIIDESVSVKEPELKLKKEE